MKKLFTIHKPEDFHEVDVIKLVVFCREAMEMKGIKPKNHILDQKRRIRELEEKVRIQ